MIHGQQNVKFINAQQAQCIYKYRNIKEKQRIAFGRTFKTGRLRTLIFIFSRNVYWRGAAAASSSSSYPPPPPPSPPFPPPLEALQHV
jgi:hypothetical protein